MMAFARALLNHELLSAETTALMFEGKVDSRPGEQYAYGFIVRANGSVGHGGGFPGVICTKLRILMPPHPLPLSLISPLRGGGEG